MRERERLTVEREKSVWSVAVCVFVLRIVLCHHHQTFLLSFGFNVRPEGTHQMTEHRMARKHILISIAH